LFESYKLISAENQRIETKKNFKKLYDAMKKLEPKTEKVSWS